MNTKSEDLSAAERQYLERAKTAESERLVTLGPVIVAYATFGTRDLKATCAVGGSKIWCDVAFIGQKATPGQRPGYLSSDLATTSD